MADKISPVATSILTLLNNVDELIVQSNNRQDARDVMTALTIYANSKNYPIPHQKIDNFHAVLLDARPETISFIVKDIAGEVIINSRKKGS
jgi:hypothetical protein